MSEQSGNNGVWVFLAGAALGVAAGLLLAPRTGRESRKRLARWLEDLEGESRDLLKEGRAMWERGKEAAQQKTEKIKQTLESVTQDLGNDF